MRNGLKKFLVLSMCTLLTVASVPVTAQAATAKISKKSTSIVVGKTVQLKMKNTKKKVKWSSSNKKVATVSKKGLVKGKKVGKATITAKVGKKAYKCKVTVKVGLNYTKKSLKKGQTFNLKLMGNSKKVKWSTSKKSVAKVTSKGKVKAVGAGKATITAKVGSKKYKCAITVVNSSTVQQTTKPSTNKPETTTKPAAGEPETTTKKNPGLEAKPSGDGDKIDWGELITKDDGWTKYY